MKKCHAVCRRVKAGDTVLFIGDSNTWGGLVDFENAFPALVGNALGINAINSGVYGTHSESWLPWGTGAALWDAFITPYSETAHAAVIMLGSNDAVISRPLPHYLGNMLILATQLSMPIYLVTPPQNQAAQWMVDLYSAHLLEIGDQLDPVCSVLDSRTVLSEPDDFFEDGLHLNVTGHENLSAALISEFGSN